MAERFQAMQERKRLMGGHQGHGRFASMNTMSSNTLFKGRGQPMLRMNSGMTIGQLDRSKYAIVSFHCRMVILKLMRLFKTVGIIIID
jgi:hypothetical protein